MGTEKFLCSLGINRSNAELNPICHLLALLGAHHILHVGRIRVKGTVEVLLDGLTCDGEKNMLYIWETRDMRTGDFLESAYLDSVQQIPMGLPLKTKLSKRDSFSPDFLLQKDECSHHGVACVCLGDSQFQLFIQTTGYHEPSCISHNVTRGHPNTVLFNFPQLAVTTAGNNNKRYLRS